jgi:23S rRNA (uracil1939-C5)-methyltransferase
MNAPGTHDFAPVDDEPLARDALREVLRALASVDLTGLTRVELRTDGTKVAAAAQGTRSKGRSRSAAERIPLDHVAVDGKVIRGDPRLDLTVCGVRHRISPRSFFQVNLEVNALLVQRVTDHLMALKPSGVLDLYGGIGNLSFPAAAQGVPVTLMDNAGSSARDARGTAKSLGLPVDVRTADVGRFRAGDAFFDVAVLDPPRAGAPGVVDQLLVTRPRAILYVSCNPRTLGRDIGAARRAGYAITQLVSLDMFPGTPHAEALCLLERA